MTDEYANEGLLGFLPFLGYHHFLMIFIAVAIILLCKLPQLFFSALDFVPHDLNHC